MLISLTFIICLDFMRAVGASSRIFELLDRMPAVRNAGGTRLEKLEGIDHNTIA